jgi:hypothetical protein
MAEQNAPGVLVNAALRQLSGFGRELKRRAAVIWEAAKPHIRKWWLGLQRMWQWLKLRPQVALPIAGLVIILVLVVFGLSAEYKDHNGVIHHPHADILGPIATFAVALGAAGAAVTAWKRHIAQTDADRQRRITESFGKSVEQLVFRS